MRSVPSEGKAQEGRSDEIATTVMEMFPVEV